MSNEFKRMQQLAGIKEITVSPPKTYYAVINHRQINHRHEPFHIITHSKELMINTLNKAYKELTGDKPVPGQSNFVTESIESLEGKIKQLYETAKTEGAKTLGVDVKMDVNHNVTGQAGTTTEEYKKYFESFVKNDLLKNESWLSEAYKAMTTVNNKGK